MLEPVLSNDFNVLFDHFCQSFKKAAPFVKQCVVVPSFATASYIKEKLVKELGVSMGLEFSFLQPKMRRLSQHFFPELTSYKPLEYALYLQENISLLIDQFDQLSLMEQEIYRPVREYILNTKGEKDWKKVVFLSDSLSSQFYKYSLFAESIEDDWEEKPLHSWQQGLWKKLKEQGKLSLSHQKLLKAESSSKKYPEHLYFFGFNAIPSLYLTLLERVQDDLSCKFYQLSPSRHFWTDIKTPAEKAALFKKLREMNTSVEELDELSAYMQDSNPLLASLGKNGRDLQYWIEEKTDPLEAYVLPKRAMDFKEYQEAHEGLDHSFIDGSMTLLKHLQLDILSMRCPQEVIDKEVDSSLKIIEANSAEREVEGLYDYLLQTFDENPSLEMNDIMVLVADIDHYIPYIESIFSRVDSPFEVLIHDYPFSVKNSLLRGLYLLIDLSTGRWDKKTLFSLFRHPLFKSKFSLTDEVDDWERWSEALNIQWGRDPLHQKQVLKNDYDLEPQENNAFSWSEFTFEMLSKLSQTDEDEPLSYALSGLTFSDCSSLNRLVEILTSLEKDLLVLTEQKANFTQWSQYLAAILKSYFVDTYEESVEYKKLVARFTETRLEDKELKDQNYPFQTYWYFLKKDLSVFHTERYSHQAQSISFYSLYSRPVAPSKVTCILGLGDESFPRNPHEDPLFDLGAFSQKAYCPKLLDEDRYQFLERLLSTEDKLYLSYLGQSSTTHKASQPSLVITELISYLDQYYRLDGEKPSNSMIQRLPVLKFDAAYFAQKNHHMDTFLLAQSFYREDKKEALPSIFSELNKPSTFDLKSKLHNQVISLQDLMQFVRNPIETTLKERDQIVLEDNRWENKEQNYVLTPLQRALLKMKLFKRKPVSLETKSLPGGLFRSALQEQLSEDLAKSDGYMQRNQVKPEDLYFIELREDILRPTSFAQNHWLYPPLKLEISKDCLIKITGVLEGVHEKGLFLTCSSNFENIWCHWPAFLVALVLPISFDSSFHFLGSQKERRFKCENPLRELKSFIYYYLQGQAEICPFLPEWILTWNNGSLDAIKTKIKKDIDSDFFTRPTLKKLFPMKTLPEDSIFDEWHALFGRLFSSTLRSIGSS